MELVFYALDSPFCGHHRAGYCPARMWEAYLSDRLLNRLIEHPAKWTIEMKGAILPLLWDEQTRVLRAWQGENTHRLNNGLSQLSNLFAMKPEFEWEDHGECSFWELIGFNIFDSDQCVVECAGFVG